MVFGYLSTAISFPLTPPFQILEQREEEEQVKRKTFHGGKKRRNLGDVAAR